MKELFPLFLGNLEDSIPSVRQGAAVSIGSVVKTYGKWDRLIERKRSKMTYYNHTGDEMVEKAIDIIKERLPLVVEQATTVDDDRFVNCHFLT